MSGNSIGKQMVLTTFGESHGVAVGGILDGLPAGLKIDLHFIQSQLNRRSSGHIFFTSSRKEEDRIEILSGVFNELTTGAPVAFIIRNKNQRPGDYGHLKDIYRPSHADFTYEQKYGIRDWRGGGRASARETVSRVAGGAIAQLLLKQAGISFLAYTSRIGTVRLGKLPMEPGKERIASSPVGCPDLKTSERMIRYLRTIHDAGDTAGGVITCIIRGVPAGLGEPVFDKLQADLAKAMLSISSVKGFEYGSGFGAAGMKGSENNDPFVLKNGKIGTLTNHSGGIQGGISNGADIYFNVAFKPVPTLKKDQPTLNKKGESVIMKGKGRHDVCVVPRSLPIVEAMAALVIADHWLRMKAGF